MVFLGALMRGITTGMINNGISTLTGHIQIHKKGFHDDPSIENRITDPAIVRDALSRVLPDGALWTERVRVPGVAANARHSSGITLVGINPTMEAQISFIGKAITRGRYLHDQEDHGIVIGETLLEKFDTKIGHKLVLMSQSASGEVASKAFRIVGTFRAELKATEKQYAFVTKHAAQHMLGLKNQITEICILMRGSKGLESVKKSLHEYLPPEKYEVMTWQELLPLLKAYLKIYDEFIFIWYLVVFIAMGFGIVNTTLMAVLERVREFGLLQALGMRPIGIVAEVIAESFILLVLGMLGGNMLAIGCISWLSGRGLDLSNFAAGAEFAGMSRIIYPDLQVKDWLMANLVVLVLGLAVSCYPAIKASRYTPVKAFAHT